MGEAPIPAASGRRVAPLAPATSAMLSGFQFSLIGPAVALLLVELFGATPAQVGLVLALYNAAGFLVALLVPRYADGTGNFRTPMLAAGASAVALPLLFAASPALPWGAAALIVLGGLSSVGMTLFWGYLRSGGTSPEGVIRLRALVSFAWVTGPPLATILVTGLGPRWLLIAVGAVATIGLLATVFVLRDGPRPPHHVDADAPPAASRGLLVAVIAAFVGLQATNTAAVSVMTLFVRDHLGLDLLWAGIALGAAAGLEVPGLFLVGRLLGRFPATVLVASGCVAGMLYYALMPLAATPAALIALQVLNAYFYSVVAGVGLTWFQDVIPGAAFAAGVLANTYRAGAVLSGGLIALAGVTTLGYSAVYLASAAICLVVLGLIVWAGRHERHSPKTTPSQRRSEPPT